MKIRILLTLPTLALLCLVGNAQAMPISNIVQNGGFETGQLGPWEVTHGGTRAHAAAATQSAFGVDHDSAHTGNWGAFAGPVGARGFLSQDLSTVPGSIYEVSFWLAGNQTEAADAAGASGSPSLFEVFWNDSLVFKTSNPPATYTEFTFTGLLATHHSTDLKFGFRDDSGVFHLDDVSAGISAPVPEFFSTLWLSLPAILMLAAARFAGKRLPLSAYLP